MIFKKELRDKYLDGRSVRYMANKLEISEAYLCSILKGNRKCGKRLAKDIGMEFFK